MKNKGSKNVFENILNVKKSCVSCFTARQEKRASTSSSRQIRVKCPSNSITGSIDQQGDPTMRSLGSVIRVIPQPNPSRRIHFVVSSSSDLLWAPNSSILAYAGRDRRQPLHFCHPMKTWWFLSLSMVVPTGSLRQTSLVFPLMWGTKPWSPKNVLLGTHSTTLITAPASLDRETYGVRAPLHINCHTSSVPAHCRPNCIGIYQQLELFWGCSLLSFKYFSGFSKDLPGRNLARELGFQCVMKEIRVAQFCYL